MENNVYKLVLEIPPPKEGSNTTTAPTSNGQSNETESAKDKQGGGKKAVLKTVAVAGTVYSMADKIASLHTSTVTLRTGFENQQAKYQAIQGIARRGVSVASWAISGAMMGGGAPGAIVGTVLGIANQAIDMAGTINEVNISRNVENTQIFLNSVRMGAGANRGGRE